jgi:hypothetical protein
MMVQKGGICRDAEGKNLQKVSSDNLQYYHLCTEVYQRDLKLIRMITLHLILKG